MTEKIKALSIENATATTVQVKTVKIKIE